MRSQRGQTLIETIVAIFILTTGLTSGLALAITTFAATSEISDKLVATGLAREGTELMRRMRDSNWMVGSENNVLTSCPDLGSDQFCYPSWLTERYSISGQTGNGSVYRLVFNPTAQGNKWTASLANPATDDFRFYTQSDGSLSHILSSSPTKFFRQVSVIYTQTSAPYSVASPLTLFRSVVWWHGKRCPQITNLINLSDTNCKIVTEELLSNWRNY